MRARLLEVREGGPSRDQLGGGVAMPRFGRFALMRVQDLPAGEQGSQLAGLEQEAPRVSLAHVQRRDEKPARTDQTPHLREEWPVEEVEVAHQIPGAIEPDVRRLEVRHLRFD